MIDAAYSNYVNDLSRKIILAGTELHINALIDCGSPKIAAKSYLFYQSNVLRLNMQRVDRNTKPMKRFEEEMTIFSQTLIAAKKQYDKYFSAENTVLTDTNISEE